MKKLFLFTVLSVLTISLSSCSSDDSNGSVNVETAGTVSFTYDGVSKTYTTISVEVEEDTDEETGEVIDTYLYITASDNGSSTDFVTFSTYVGEIGAGGLYNANFNLSNNTYLNDFNSNIAINSNNKVKGTFSGMANRYDNATQQVTEYPITNGVIDITYANE